MRHEILNVVAGGCGVSVLDILGDSKAADHIKARHLAAYFLRTKAGLSFPKIGQALGGRHHATIMHSMERVEFKPERFEPELSRLKAALAGGGIYEAA